MATILLVDDEQIFCDLLKEMLKSHGHEVLTAYNGRDALNLFRQHHPKITVLDLRMPEMARYAAPPPDWGKHLIVSCSS